MLFELKSASIPVVALLLKTVDTAQLCAALKKKFSSADSFFDNDALVLDLNAIQRDDGTPDFKALIATLQQLKMVPVAIRNANAQQTQAAQLVGLTLVTNTANPTGSTEKTQPVNSKVEVREVLREVEVVREGSAEETIVIEQQLRSGQRIYAQNADLVVLGDVNSGAEVVADGNLHIYGTLHGRAIAGNKGNPKARIFTLNFNAPLVAIAGVYLLAEDIPAAKMQKQAVQIKLKHERLILEPLYQESSRKLKF